MRVPNMLLVSEFHRIKNGATKSRSAKLVLYALAAANCNEKDFVFWSQPKRPVVRKLLAFWMPWRARRSRPTIIHLLDVAGFDAGNCAGGFALSGFTGANGLTNASSKS